MAQKKKRKRRLPELAGVPWEIWMDGSRVWLLGFARVVMENHRGVARCQTDEVVVRLKEGSLCVKGNGLSVSHMGKDHVSVDGHIDALLRGD
nr:YabP/YqfC family sporulation protein [bacterium]